MTALLGGPSPRPLAFELPDPVRWVLEVVEIGPLTPGVTRVRARAHSPDDGPGQLLHAPGQDVTVALPGRDGTVVKRRYTIASYDAASGLLDLAVVAHGDGPGARWLGSAEPGARVDAVGPRGKVTLVSGVSTHLFVGDEASLAAVTRLVAAIRPGGRAVVVADVEDDRELRPLAVGPGVGLAAHWLERAGAPAESPDRVLAALESIELDESDVHAYVLGEAHVVAAAHGALASRLGPHCVSAKAYWRVGRANAERGEPDGDL
ncbi:MAG: siderophore-interacting protein [Actinomycetota bacterium]|nr:siderophore-interacting protein [Actinomycetota bacterium]